VSVVGLDLDNTLACYDELLHRVACERGMVDAECPVSKQAVRDRVRLLSGGEVEWQRLQGLAYGPRMLEASLIEGVPGFLTECRARAISVFIVSHKTEYAPHDATRTPLRPMALRWMDRQGFFAPERFGLTREAVHFASTRGEKVAQIRALGCTHFVDDLDETFREAEFPVEVERILYSPLGCESSVPGVMSFRSWKDIAQKRFGWDV
jgi:hypothetical protein